MIEQQTDRPIRVQISSSDALSLDSAQPVSDLIDRTNCPTCTSGMDVRFDRARQAVATTAQPLQ